MAESNTELHAKFIKFRESYEAALVWLADAGGNSDHKESSALDAARRSVDASEMEFEFFKKLMREQIPKPD